MIRMILPAALALALLLTAPAAGADPNEPDDRLGLADLAAYHRALSGQATAADAPAAEPARPANFRDLWDHPERWKGHRVQVRGTLVRSFRQDAVGGFPALVEAWLRTPAGDLLCTVFPGEAGSELGREVSFQGTYLKTVRYAGGDQPRLAPCVVGESPPRSVEPAGVTPSPSSSPSATGNRPIASWPRESYLVVLALALAGMAWLSWRTFSPPYKGGARGGKLRAHDPVEHDPSAADLPLLFLDQEPAHGPAAPDARPR